MQTSCDLVIIGAGAAGLAAARAAIAAGLNIELVEAASRIGGRGFTDTTSFPAPFDMGCQWLHAATINPYTAIADRLGIRYRRYNFNYRIHDGTWWLNEQLMAEFSRDLSDFYDRVAGAGHAGKDLPVDMRGRVIYYVGPVPAAANEIIGPAGPTTASRMDRFVDKVLQATALYAMIGKAERGPSAIAAIKKYKVPYLIAVGGAAYLISKSIRSAKVVAFEDLGMEAIHEFEVTDMPVTVAVDAEGRSIHDDGPARWRQHILQRTV